MKITTKSRYAIRAVYALTYLGGKEKAVALTQISESEGISRKYLEQIFINLKKEGFVKGSRGASGGYMLTKDPSEISLKDIIYLMDGPITPVACTEDDSCEKTDHCQVNWMWFDLKNMVDNYLEGISIQDLVDSRNKGVTDVHLS